MPRLSDRVGTFTDSVIRRMTRINNQYDSINLSQGFPDFDPPKELTDALAKAAHDGPHQYAVTFGAQNFREALAKKTFNPRLGIEGGISILGTTGIVEPMSEQALVDTIHVELRQRREGGADYVLLAPGNYGADYIKNAMGIDPATAVMTSNFIGDALEMCRELGFRGALLIGHIGKLVKLAGGMWNTHSRYGDCRTDILTACAAAEGLDAAAAEALLHCATCDDALRILQEQGLYEAVLHRLAGRIDAMLPYKCGDMEAGAILFSKEYGYLCETKGAAALLRRIKED